MFTTTDSSTLTLVIGANLNTKVDLYNLFKKIDISDKIIYAKYNGSIKGDCSNSKFFYNQVSVEIYSELFDKYINLKIFSNGKIHFSGIKSMEQARYSANLILDEIISIKETQKIETVVINGICYDKLDYLKHGLTDLKSRENIVNVYSYDKKTSTCSKLGFKKGKDYCINSEICIFTEGHFVTKTFKDSVKCVYDTNGELVYTYEYVHKFKRKNNIVKGKTFYVNAEGNFDIVDNYGNVTAVLVFTKNEDYTREILEDNEYSFELKISCVSDEFVESFNSPEELYDSVSYRYEMISEKFNIQLEGNENYKFNKERIHNVLINNHSDTISSYLDVNKSRLLIKFLEFNTVYVLYGSGRCLASIKSDETTSKQTLLGILNSNLELLIKKPELEQEFQETLTIQDLL
jgi:hypothetical protein